MCCYTPYLSKLVNDIFLGNLTYYNRLNERSAVAASFRYFSNGEIELRQTADEEPLLVKPNELLFDVSYSLRLSERFAMAVAGRYIRSDLKLQTALADASAANSFAVDIAACCCLLLHAVIYCCVLPHVAARCCVLLHTAVF